MTPIVLNRPQVAQKFALRYYLERHNSQRLIPVNHLPVSFANSCYDWFMKAEIHHNKTRLAMTSTLKSALSDALTLRQ